MLFRLKDGAHHVVDSGDLAFQLAAEGAMKDGTQKPSVILRSLKKMQLIYVVFLYSFLLWQVVAARTNYAGRGNSTN